MSRCCYVTLTSFLFYANMFSLLLQLSPELQLRAARCPGFLHTAVLSYMQLLQVYLDGLELKAASQLSNNQVTQISGSFYTVIFFFFFSDTICETHRQVESFQILGPAKQLLLRVISQIPTTSLSSRQLTQVTLETGCVDTCSSAETCR